MKKLFTILFVLIAFSAYSQSGITWSAVMNVAPAVYDNVYPRITTDAGGNPLVIWGRQSDESVFISRWNGTAFTTPLKINPSWLTVATQYWQGPHIAAKGDTVYVVVKRTPEALDTNHIYIMRSTDGGISFAAPSRVDFIADSISRFPTVAIDNAGNPIVGFMKINPNMSDARWVVAKSSDLGNTFSTDVKASGWSGGGAMVCDCCPGSIISYDTIALMLYRDNLSNIRDLWAGISTDGANSFTQGMPIDQGNWMLMSCPSSGPDGVIINDTLYTAYMSGATGSNMVYMSAASVSAMTGAAGSLLTGQFAGLNSQNYPRIAAAGNAIAIVWKQVVNGADQLALKFTGDIAAGLPASYDSVDLNNVTNTDVALTNGNIFIVWQDDNSGTVRFRSGAIIPSAVDEADGIYGLSIYPSLFDDFIQINNSGKRQIAVRITDVKGKEIYSEDNAAEKYVRLGTSAWKAGMYFVSARNKNSGAAKFYKVIKSR